MLRMKFKHWIHGLVLAVFCLGTQACTKRQNSNLAVDVPNQGESAIKQINLESKSGSAVKGLVKLSDSESGLFVNVSLTGLAPNSVHGFHIHEFGDCSGIGAEAAGEHFKPQASMVHGSPEIPNHHAGDLGNLTADASGNVMTNITAKDLSLKHHEGRYTVENLTLVVHSNPDNFTTQPSGDSGDRIACGIIR